MASVIHRATARALLTAILIVGGLAGCARREPVRVGEGREWPEHLAHSVAAVGFPGARRTYQVGPGACVWTGEVGLRWSVPGDTSARATPIAFEADGVPIAHLNLDGSKQSLAIVAAAVPAASGDTSLEMSVRVTVTWRAPEPGECVLALEVEDQPAVGVRAWDAPLDAPAMTFSDGQPTRGGRRLARLPAPFEASPGSHAPHALRATWRRQLRPGQRAVWDVSVPLYPLAGRGRTSRLTHDEVVAEARRLWRRKFEQSTALRTGTPRYDALARASLVTLLTCEERYGGALVPIGNPFQYRDVWLRDGARSIRALSLAGQIELAQEAARAFVRFQRPSGALLSQRGQLDGTGQALWAFEQAAAHPPDPRLASELLPAALGGVRWLSAQSESTLAMGLPWPGLLPSGDPGDNELVRAPLVGNDAWAIAGAEATARLARLAGDAAAESTSSALAASLRGHFARALARLRSEDIPPSWAGGGLDWGNFAVSYPTRTLPPSHPRVRALIARGLALGLARYDSPDSLHSYLGTDLAMSAMLDGRGDIARAYLDSLLARSSSTLGQAELFTGSGGGFGRNLPPHATAAATALDLAHALVAVEDGDTLVLGAGLDADAWAGASIARAPTRFGVLTASFARAGEHRFSVRIQGVSAPVRVRVPGGRRLARVLGPATATPDGRWIVPAPGASEVEFETSPGPGREPLR